MAKNNSNLVRPRTTIQDAASSTNQHTSRKRQRHSFQLLFLCGTCMFLFILCVCLVATLVLVSHSLSSGALRLSNCAKSNRTTPGESENFWWKLLDIATTKVFDATHLLINSTGFSIDKSYNEVRDKDIAENKYNAIDEHGKMSTHRLSKIVEQLTWRLPQEIRPKLYNLHLRPDLVTKTFTGNVSIELEVKRPISFIAVHSKWLNISSTSLVRNAFADKPTDNVPIANTFEYPKFEYWVTELERPLDVGEYTLNMAFNGSLVGHMTGFYQSSYRDFERNVTRYIATSKFEPTFARQAFPCFDEPAMKAKFKVSIVRPLGDGYSALSNMDEETTEERPQDKTAIVHFKTSVPMSTYLAVFVVSDFKFKNQTVRAKGIGKDIELRVFAQEAQLNKADFALDTAVAVTEYFIDYFKIEYPLPKLDLAAIPDFVSGAMENWGLVTFRETALLYDKSSSSTKNKYRVAQVIAHELAHMWFGNLVTMTWWNELWLNEGFATYLQYKGMHHVFPDWGVLNLFLTETLHNVMTLDATLASHPIVQPADNPDQITELFDSITYSKGASVIRMLADFVGEDNFAKSVTNYLTKHKYKNAITDDLLTEIENIDTTNKDIKYIMDTWTKQSGLPVVQVEKVNKGNTLEYRLKQKRFLSNPANEGYDPNDSPFKYRWTIPLTYVTSQNTTDVIRKWFNYGDLDFTITVPSDVKWIKINKDQVGYYRVNYPLEDWKTLSETLLNNLETLSVSDRAHLLNDAFSLAEATQLNYDVALDLTRYLEKEPSNVPWSVATAKLLGIKNLMYNTENYSKFLRYGRGLVHNLYTKLGWSVTDNQNDNLLRVSILNFACSVGHSECLENAGKHFNAWLNNSTDRPAPDLRNVIYYYGMVVNGNEENWDKVWNLYLNEADAQEKIKLMDSLSAIQVPWILKRFVDLAWDEKNVRGQDYFSCLANIAANRIGEPIVWDFVRENWNRMVSRFGLNERYLGRLIPSITGRFASEVKLNDLKQFFEKYPEAGAGAAARKEAIQRIENNIQWLKNNEVKLNNWLSQNSSDEPNL